MKYECKTIDGINIDMGQPVFVKINKSEDAPADDITVMFPFNNKIDTYKEINIYSREKLIFNGDIDEQYLIYDKSGITVKLIARSLAARLIDNEAMPQVYCMPSLDIIFDKHVKPYGFTKCIGNKDIFPDEFKVTKGMSEWDVLKNFCETFLKTYPKISSDGVIDASLDNLDSEIKLSNTSGIKYNSIYIMNSNYKPISEILLKSKEESSYINKVVNDYAVNRGITRKRYLNNVSLDYAKKAIDASNLSSFVVNVKAIGKVDAQIGQGAILEDKIFGNIDDLIVSKIKYSLDESGEMTELTLRRRSI